jgi:hypothetical protein
MLNHLLAGVVALGSLVLFWSGFFFPEVQRKTDLAWSGVALLYALLLFAEGDHTPISELLGHIASVALILWFGWQTLQQRRQFSAPETQTAIPGSLDALMPFLKAGWGRIRVSYGEASVWVQDQLGKGNEGTPAVKMPPDPLQKINDEHWENNGASASPATESSSEVIPESNSREATTADHTTEAIAAHPEFATHPESTLSTPEISIANPSAIAPPSSAQSPAEAEPPAPPLLTDHPTSETVDISHDNPDAEKVAESIPVHEMHQDAPAGKNVDESAHASTQEDYDDSWPPEDPVT